MANWTSSIVAIASLAVLGKVWGRWRAGKRAAYIRSYTFPAGAFAKVQEKHPDLTAKDCDLIAQALRQYFLAYLRSGFRSVAMPSRIVDDLWHEFILCTRIYHRFCDQAFGRFMHHTPAAVLGTVEAQNVALRRCWRYACREEGIHPRKASRLPLLFAIDGRLKVPGGFRYALDCQALGGTDQRGNPIYCTVDFGAGCSTGADSWSASSADNGCSGDGGCSSGCGGD